MVMRTLLGVCEREQGRADAGKLGRFQEETFSQIEIFVPGRDM